MQGKLLAEIIDNTHDLTFFYLGKMDEKDWFSEFEFNGKKLNSVAWTLCHMAWAENYLLLKACSDTESKVEWLALFGIGTTPPSLDKYPSPEEIKKVMNDIHTKSLEVVGNLSNEALQQPNNTELKFKKGDAKLQIINHHIRHEAMHIGHLSILCKLLNVKTI